MITITILVLAGVLTAAVGTCLLQVVDAGALLGQEVACVAVDVLDLVGGIPPRTTTGAAPCPKGSAGPRD